MSGEAHVPVLLGPVLEGLAIRGDGIYVDATFGRGGHSKAILERLGTAGRLIAIDRDPAAIASEDESLRADPRFELVRGDFAELRNCIEARGLDGKVDGLLLDLGVSSPQLDDANRGFSFRHDGPLDMRMDPDRGISAAEYLRSVGEKELTSVLRKYGEESQAVRIARAIVRARESTPIETTGQLAAIVESVVPAHLRRKHPATRSFQAIRIFLNRELENLAAALEQSLVVLSSGGRLCVISFHSLEDRIVKRFMRTHSREAEQYRGMPSVPAEFRPKLRLVGKAITASAAEIQVNARSRSARLRVAERL